MIDLCVVSFNTQSKLQRLIDTVYSDAADDRGWRLLVADNGSGDDSPQYIKSESRIDDYRLNENIGYARACNQLASIGDGDIVGLLNSDVWFTSSDVHAIQRSFDIHPEMSIMGPKQRDEEGRITHAGITGTNDKPQHRGWHVSDPDDVLFRDFAEMVTVSGSAFFVRRSVWETLSRDCDYTMWLMDLADMNLIPRNYEPVGAFLPTPHYYEESWCAYFARSQGYKAYYDGSVSIGHSWHASHDKGSVADTTHFKISQNLFRMSCDKFGIQHEW